MVMEDTEIWKLKFADGECYCEEICIDDEWAKGKEVYLYLGGRFDFKTVVYS